MRVEKGMTELDNRVGEIVKIWGNNEVSID